MDNKQFSQPEDGEMRPEALSELPAEPEVPEEQPLFHVNPQEERVPEDETPPVEAAHISPDPDIVEVDAPLVEEADLPLPEEAEIPLPEEKPATPGPSFMERIPDVDEDYPDEDISGGSLEDARLDVPQVNGEITPDDRAMDFHGMLGHNEEEPPFDMHILDDPELSLPQEPEAAAEEADDQEYRDNGAQAAPASQEPAQAQQTPPRRRPTRKGRPKRKKGEGLLGIPNILVTFVWLALIVAIGVTAGRMMWVCAADVLAFGREDRAVTITIYESDTMDDIINKLFDNGLIRYKSLFQFYASISDAEEDIQPGIYDLNTRYDYHALVNFMSPRSSREVVNLTIPEGYSCRQIFSLLEEKRICSAVDIAAYAASGELEDYWFLENVARGDKYCLEGYLFPDTYQFYKNSTPREALEKMLDNFDHRFNEEMRAKLDALNANVTGGGYTVREVTIVASLIEKESAAPAESPRVAGVIYNRLFHWGDTPAYLNIDASIIYALDGKTDLTREDLQVDSPYNTYTNIGLPPTPISNPGVSSLEAALEPENHNYYYYVLDPSTGMHQFSSTYEEHAGYVSQFAG